MQWQHFSACSLTKRVWPLTTPGTVLTSFIILACRFSSLSTPTANRHYSHRQYAIAFVSPLWRCLQSEQLGINEKTTTKQKGTGMERWGLARLNLKPQTADYNIYSTPFHWSNCTTSHLSSHVHVRMCFAALLIFIVWCKLSAAAKLRNIMLLSE